jgi:sigma-54 dependent transcriptional regulator
MSNLVLDPVKAVAEFIKTTTSLSTERNLNCLLSQIVSAAQQLSQAAAGRLYILDRTKRYLYPEVSQNDSVPTSVPHLSPIALFLDNQRNLKNVCAFSVFSGEVVNIPDVYQYSGFDCTDLYHYDQLTGYYTQSLLTVPLLSYTEITSGVLQLFNYRDPETTQVAAFPKRLEELVKAFASQAAVAIDNTQLIEQNTRLINLLKSSNQQLEEENRQLRQHITRQSRFSATLLGNSAAMQHVFNLMEKVLDSDVTVLLRGETGTGKELIATAIHQHSPRQAGPFIAQNCAAVPESLLESELFGYKKGAFTGADKDKKGLIEVAHGGTLFLDEIGDMAVGLQAKLLRVLQDHQVRPLGAVESRSINVRLLTATHRDLEQMVKTGQFREDLYPIELPPLRQRKEDLPALLQHFLTDYADHYKKTVRGFSPEAFELLLYYDYPGNIRELKNLVERAVLLSDHDGMILPLHLDKKLWSDLTILKVPTTGKLKESVQRYEAMLIQRALQSHSGNQTRTAETLGIPRRTLVEKMERYKIKGKGGGGERKA